MVSLAEANNGKSTNSNKGYYNFYKAKPIKFVEKGVKFYVYPNGEFTFSTHRRKVYPRNSVYYNRRYAKRAIYNRVPVVRDYFGRIKRVGNVFINYNRYGKVKRIGSVTIDYRHRRLKRVGGLYIKYNRFGDIRYFGHVKPRFSRRVYNYDHFYDGMILDYDNNFFYDDDFYDDFDEYGEDDHYYYYKSKKRKSNKKGKVLKRKKEHKDYLDNRKERD